MSDQLAAALDLARRGFAVFPIDHPELDKCAGIGEDHDPDTCTERGKHPCVPFTKEATTDPQRIAMWWAGSNRNIGIACGASGVVAVDEDKLGAFESYAKSISEEIPETLTFSTGRGRHFVFEAGDFGLGNKAGELKHLAHSDVRGAGGYIVGPGSLHATGVVYGILTDVAIAPLPQWLVDVLKGPQKRDGIDWADWADKPRGLDAVPDVIKGKNADHPGERHDVLVRYACSMRARDVPMSEALALHRAVWERCEQPPVCDDPLTWQEAIGKLEDVYQRYTPNYQRPDPDVEEEALDAAAKFAREVSIEAYKIAVREAARDRVASDRAALVEVPPFDGGLLAEVLARPAEPPNRVAELIPSEAGTLVVAQRKTGKTTLKLNLARSLILGEPFLGRFDVRPISGRVGFLNFEVSAAQLARWANEVGVPSERLYLVNLRGRRNPLGNDVDREHLAALLRSQEVESLIVDPFGRAYTGKSQNDPGEVGAWLSDLDRFARGDVGVTDLILAAHAGWNGERARGASALEDWADSIITLTRDADDDSQRYFKAEGRDVEVEEDRLRFDPVTRLLSLTGAGSRKVAARSRHLDELIPAVVSVVKTNPGVTGYGLQTALREAGESFQRGDEVKAAKEAVNRGELRFEDGPRNSKKYYITSTYPDLSPPIPSGTGPHLSPPLLMEVGWVGEVKQVDLSQQNPLPLSNLAPSLDDAVDLVGDLLGGEVIDDEEAS